MKLNISGLSFRLTRAIAQHVERRIGQALAAVSPRIDAVTVHLGDINGDKGGVDKHCRVVVWMHHLGTVVTSAVEADLYVAIDAAARKARKAVWRSLKRREMLRRYAAGGMQQLPA